MHYFIERMDIDSKSIMKQDMAMFATFISELNKYEQNLDGIALYHGVADMECVKLFV